MVDVKKVTATIKKPIYYFNEGSSVSNQYINFNPADNPITPATNSTVYTIDPFALFQQEDSLLKVKIPFTRFYKIKCAMELTNTDIVTGTPDPDIFSIAKPILTCSQSINIQRLSNGVTTDIKTNIFNQDGVAFLTYRPNMTNWPFSGYDKIKTLSPAVIEGIVELYAGDVLTFQHTRSMVSEVTITSIEGTLALNNLIPSMSAPVGPWAEYWNFAQFITPSLDPTASQEPLISVNPIYRAWAGFFFEISEITDL